MTFKKLFYSVLCLMIILTVACSTTSKIENKYLNKKAPARGKSLIGIDYHIWNYRNYRLEYHIEIDDSADTLFLKNGTLTYNAKNIMESNSDMKGKAEWYRFKSLVLYCLFIDKDGIVRSVEKADVKAYEKSLTDVIPIEVSFPYNSEFEEIKVFPVYYIHAWL